jgi:hypothetical protein
MKNEAVLPPSSGIILIRSFVGTGGWFQNTKRRKNTRGHTEAKRELESVVSAL